MKRLLLGLIVLLLCAGTLAGCGIRGNVNDNSIGGGASNEEGLDDPFRGANNVSSDFKPIFKDLKGRTLKFAHGTSLTGNADEINWQPTMEKDPITYTSMKDTEKRYNCKIKYFGMTGNVMMTSLQNSYLTGLIDYDVYSVSFPSIPSIINTDACLAMSDHYPFGEDPAWAEHPYMADKGWWLGKKYGVNNSIPLGGYAYWYNKDLMAKFNIKDPWTFFATDTWNWENFRQMALKATQRVPEASQCYYGWACETPYNSLIISNNADIIKIINGKPTFSLNTPEAKEAIEFVNKLINQDKVFASDADLIGIGANKSLPALFSLSTQRVLFFPYVADFWYCQTVDFNINPKSIGYIYTPKGPSAKDYRIESRTDNSWWVIPAKISDPDGVTAAVQDFMAFWSPWKTNPIPYDQKFDEFYQKCPELFASVNSGVRMIDFVKEIPKRTVITYDLNFQVTGMLDEMFESIRNGSTSINTALAIQGDLIQTQIDSYIKKD